MLEGPSYNLDHLATFSFGTQSGNNSAKYVIHLRWAYCISKCLRLWNNCACQVFKIKRMDWSDCRAWPCTEACGFCVCSLLLAGRWLPLSILPLRSRTKWLLRWQLNWYLKTRRYIYRRTIGIEIKLFIVASCAVCVYCERRWWLCNCRKHWQSFHSAVLLMRQQLTCRRDYLVTPLTTSLCSRCSTPARSLTSCTCSSVWGSRWVFCLLSKTFCWCRHRQWIPEFYFAADLCIAGAAVMQWHWRCQVRSSVAVSVAFVFVWSIYFTVISFF